MFGPPLSALLEIMEECMGRDLRAEGWGPEDCYPDGAYEAEERRKKIAWWQGLAEKTGWPKTGTYFALDDLDHDAQKGDMILKHETGVEIPFRIDDGETPEYISKFFGDVFPGATVLVGDF